MGERSARVLLLGNDGMLGHAWQRLLGREGIEHETRSYPELDLTRRESEEAVAAARQATHAVGIEEPPPRLAGEAVTGPVVRVVAFGAGARRAFARFASDVTPMAKSRATTARTVKLVAATRSRSKRKAG